MHVDACVSMRDGVCACAYMYVCMNVSTYVYALGLSNYRDSTILLVYSLS